MFAAAIKPRVKLKANPSAARLETLEAQNANLRRAVADLQGLLAAAQVRTRYVEDLETECAVWRAREAAWREAEGRDLVEALPKSARRRVRDLAFPAPAGAPLAYELCNCIPSRAAMWASRRV